MTIRGFSVFGSISIVSILVVLLGGCMRTDPITEGVAELFNIPVPVISCHGCKPNEGETEEEEVWDLGPAITINLPGDIPLELVRIYAGTFMMGRYPGEQDTGSDEYPEHEVTLSQNYYMGKYELTQAQWRAVTGTNLSQFSGDTFPVESVAWDEIRDFFLTRLNNHIIETGQGPFLIRLPTEAEWEYACRAGSTTRYYWGDDPDFTLIKDYAWCGKYIMASTHPVGEKLPNAFGLYDMSGNVWEWCQDKYSSEYEAGPLIDPTGPKRGILRVIRGGAYQSKHMDCRSASRKGRIPIVGGSRVGLRVVAVSLPDEQQEE